MEQTRVAMLGSRPEQGYRVASIDASTKSTGIAVWDSNCLIIADTLSTGDKLKMEQRFPIMSRSILDALDNALPDEVVIEEAVVLRNAQTQRFLLRLQGVVYGWCLTHGAGFYTVRPTEWRKLLHFTQGRNVKRNALKQQAVEYVRKNGYGNEHSEDACEAICIGLAWLERCSTSKDNKEEQQK